MAVALNGAKTFYDEKHDKSTFIKNIILDNILPGDIFMRSRELHFGSDVPHAVLLVRQSEKADIAAVDVMQSLFPDRQHDFVISINDTDIALVKEVKPGIDIGDLQSLQRRSRRRSTRSFISRPHRHRYGSQPYQGPRGLHSRKRRSHRGRESIRYEKKRSSIMKTSESPLIYQLPTTMCKMFLSSVQEEFHRRARSGTLFTINKFFENNLNVSETSRKLFVHRNTLVYRLEKIKKITDLDLASLITPLL
jgi:carbohydrate diacid regulator